MKEPSEMIVVNIKIYPGRGQCRTWLTNSSLYTFIVLCRHGGGMLERNSIRVVVVTFVMLAMGSCIMGKTASG